MQNCPFLLGLPFCLLGLTVRNEIRPHEARAGASFGARTPGALESIPHASLPFSLIPSSSSATDHFTKSPSYRSAAGWGYPGTACRPSGKNFS